MLGEMKLERVVFREREDEDCQAVCRADQEANEECRAAARAVLRAIG